MPDPGPALVLLCDVCREPLGGAGDYLRVSVNEAVQRGAELNEWDERHRTPGGGISFDLSKPEDAPPPDVRWAVYHGGCDPDPDNEEGYWFGAERCTNFAELLYWTAHLMEKRWVRNTDWDHRLRRILHDSGAVDP